LGSKSSFIKTFFTLGQRQASGFGASSARDVRPGRGGTCDPGRT